MGEVYQARQTALERLVAIKLLPIEISSKHDFAASFRREAQAMARLNHPNIVSVYDFGQTTDGRLYCIMEYVQGSNLFEIIHKVGLDLEQTLSVIEQICAALGYAHGKGVVHRDIKPGNVLVDTESNVKVADFGLARLMDSSADNAGATTTDFVFGTPDYMAPEQRRDMDVDHRADIYSLGIMTYEMLCGEVPRGAFQLPSQRTGCDGRIDQIVLKAMQQSPDLRYQSTAEIEADIAAARIPMPVARPVAVAKPLAVTRPVAPPRPQPVAARPAAAVPQIFAPLTPNQPRPHVQMQQEAPSKGPWVKIAVAGGVFLLAIVLYVATKPGKPSRDASTSQPAKVFLPTPQPVIIQEIKPTPPPVDPSPALANTISSPPDTQPQPSNLPAENSKPAPEADPRSEVEKWLATTDAQMQEAYEKQVAKTYEAALAGLATRYLAALDAGLGKFSAAGQLEQALLWRNERKDFEQTKNIATDDATTPPALRTLRAEFRQSLATAEQQRTANVKTHYANYDAVLAKYITLLTQKQRLDDAVLLQNKRKELNDLKTTELAPKVSGTSVATITPPVGTTSAPPAIPPPNTSNSGTATQDNTQSNIRVGTQIIRGEIIMPADIATVAVKGKAIRTVGTVTKTIKSGSSAGDRFFVRLDPNIICELLIPTFFTKSGRPFNNLQPPGGYHGSQQRRSLRFENGSIFIFGEYKGYYSPPQNYNLGAIFKTGSRIAISGQYEGDTPLGVEKGLFLRDCTVIASE